MTKSNYHKEYPVPVSINGPPDGFHEYAMRVIASWNLTPKEEEIAILMLKGFTDNEIAEALNNTPKTVKHHSHTVRRKAHVTSRAELFAEIIRL